MSSSDEESVSGDEAEVEVEETKVEEKPEEVTDLSNRCVDWRSGVSRGQTDGNRQRDTLEILLFLSLTHICFILVSKLPIHHIYLKPLNVQ
jgi:hypothetical protein